MAVGLPSALLALACLIGAGRPDARPDARSDAAPVLAEPPVLESQVQPSLPEGTRFPQPEVVVLLRIEVDAAGAVHDVTLVEGAGAPFDEAALAAARRFVFRPGRLDTGEAVPVTVNFRMRLAAPAAGPGLAPDGAVRSSSTATASRSSTTARFVLTGTLLERGTRRPIEGAPAIARVGERELASALSDAEGRFELEVPALSFVLSLRPSAHEAADLPIEGEDQERREERYFLARKPSSPFEVVVRSAAPSREVTRRTLSREEVSQMPGTGGDTIKAVENLPGVSRQSFDFGPLILRGANPQDSAIFLEGQQIPQIYHFGGVRSTFNSYFLEALDFVPGNFSSDYGRATGGIVNVRVRDPASDLFHGQIDVNLYDAGLSLEGPISEHWSVGGAFHRSWIDSLVPLVLPTGQNISFKALPRYYDYQFIATYHPSAEHRFRILAYGSLDELEFLIKAPQDDPQLRGAVGTKVYFHNLLLQDDLKLAPGFSQAISVQVGLQKDQFTLGPSLSSDLGLDQISLRAAWTLDLASWLQLRFGTDSRYSWIDLGSSGPLAPKEGQPTEPIAVGGSLSGRRSFQTFDPGLFAELRIRPTEAWTITPGLRFDDYQAIHRATVDPRLITELRLLDGTTLRAGVGIYQQPPALDESDRLLGTPSLLAPRSIQAALGGSQEIIPGVTLELTGFYKWLDRLVVVNPPAYVDPAAVKYTNLGVGRIYGAELLLRAQIAPDFFGWIAYTLERSLRTDPGGAERPSDYDQPSILTVLASYKLGAGWTLGARFRLVSGAPDTPVTGSIFDTASDAFVPLYGRTNSSRLAAFHQLDVRVDKTWTFDTWTLSTYLDVQNIYNHLNQEGWTYNYDYSQRTPLTGLPLIPILGVKGQW
jgi:TonB family protein